MSEPVVNPSLGISVTQTVRSGVRLLMDGLPCPTCGHSTRRLTLRQVQVLTGVSSATLSRFLHGRSIDSNTLDRLYEWVQAGLPDEPA